MYGGYLDTVGKRFSAAFSTIETVHNFDFGPEFEIALCAALRSALPHSYGVCRGYAVNKSGNTAGDDILIYEQLQFPTLGIRESEAYLRKDKIPIEAVYVYIEAKHTLHIKGDKPQSLRRATKQVTSVKKLCSQREKVGLNEIQPGTRLRQGLEARGIPGWPQIRNPMFAVVVARRVCLDKDGPELVEPEEVDHALQESPSLPRDLNSPDLFVLGANNIALPVLDRRGTNTTEYVSPFYMHGLSDFASLQVSGQAFAVGFCSIMAALDWIKLGRMPWKDIIGSTFS